MLQRRHYEFTHWVQGRGFRPELHRIAKRHHLSGWVKNVHHHVFLEAQGLADDMDRFAKDLGARFAGEIRSSVRPAVVVPEEERFVILPSEVGAATVGELPADLATCTECIDELIQSGNRRFAYPFITCATCGPRHSIALGMPYDRVRTSMIDFPLCPDCRREYDDDTNRRYHAETISCPACGPRLQLWNERKELLTERDGALALAVEALRAGNIVAVKSVGGFHLMVDAMNSSAVGRLRERKRRAAKPFALLMRDLQMVRQFCNVSELEERALSSVAAPIVLLSKKETGGRAEPVAPGLNWWGVLLPSNPLHILLSRAVGGPLVATSGNRSGEPLCFDNDECRVRLSGIADLFLDHRRRITRPADDSVIRVIDDHPMVLRRARGYSTRVKEIVSGKRVVGTGAFLKNTVAWVDNQTLYLTPHLGELDSPQSLSRYRERLGELPTASLFVADRHPDYPCRSLVERAVPDSTRVWSMVQHHKAHVLSGMCDNNLPPPLLGVAWDGLGLGDHDELWGGEFFDVGEHSWRRVASLLPFRLLGGERATRDCRRVAASILWESGLELPVDRFGFSLSDADTLRKMFDRKLQAPPCSSVGRLFDAIAVMTGICFENEYQGQAAALVEAAAEKSKTGLPPFPLELRGEHLDWRPLFKEVALTEPGQAAEVCYRFHVTLAEAIVTVAKTTNRNAVLLTGGCFQNALLSQLAIDRLRRAGFTPYWHREIPPNDGGLSVGQVLGGLEETCV